MTGALLLAGMVLAGPPPICQAAMEQLGPNYIERRAGHYIRTPQQIWRDYERELGVWLEAKAVPGPQRQAIRDTCKAYAVDWLAAKF